MMILFKIYIICVIYMFIYQIYVIHLTCKNFKDFLKYTESFIMILRLIQTFVPVINTIYTVVNWIMIGISIHNMKVSLLLFLLLVKLDSYIIITIFLTKSLINKLLN